MVQVTDAGSASGIVDNTQSEERWKSEILVGGEIA